MRFALSFKCSKRKERKKIMRKILLVVISLALIMTFVLPSFAWYNPATNTENYVDYNTWGPRVDNVLCVISSSQTGEYNNYLAKLIDLFDWSLTPTQKAQLDGLDSTMNQWERLFYAEFGMFEVDINNQVFPGDNVFFRTALSKLMDKGTFISTELNGMGQAAHSPLWHNPTWRYAACAGFDSEIYNKAAAYQMLYDNGFRDWDSDGKVEYSPNDGVTKTEFTVVVYGRIDDSHRTALAILVNNVLTGADIVASVIGASFNVELNIVAKTTCYTKVMINYNYTLYTGGWSFGRDPDTIYFLYDSKFATKPEPWASNYPNYKSSDFDTAIEAMIAAPTMTAAHTACDLAQSVFMGDVAIIPMWNTAGYTGILSTVEHAIDMSAYGPTTSTGAYQTLMNAYISGQEYGGTLRWGLMNNWESLSVYMSSWVWDWNVMQEIYDSMIGYNPYDYAVDYGIMAQNWTTGQWTYLGEPATYVTWHLRQDLYWHDIPPKADRKYGIEVQGTGALHVDSSGNPDPLPPKQVTADDVAFTVMYIGKSSDAWNWGVVADASYCNVIDPYTLTVYYKTFMPIWAAHWCGGLPIIPKFIWEKVPIAEAGAYDALGQKTLSGSGPFTFNYTALVPAQYGRLDRFPLYQDLTPVDVNVKADGIWVEPGTDINYTIQLTNRDAEYTITGDLTFSVDSGTPETIVGIVLAPKATYETPTLNHTGSSTIGTHDVSATFTITGSPLFMHGMVKTYKHHIWSTLRVDLNLDFKVDMKDVREAAKAFGSYPSQERWDSRADVNYDFKVDMKDIRAVAKLFGWPYT
jgi:ABC-type oligopeptide transport system substrate-binding subunit